MKTWFAVVLILLSTAAFGAPTNTSIHRMVIGDKALELQDTLPLTLRQDGQVISVSISPDGKYVAYTAHSGDPDLMRLCVVRSTGGKPDVLVASPSLETLENTRTPIDIWVLDSSADRAAAWSPDSKLLAIPVRHITTDSEGNPDDSGPMIQVLTTAKFQRALFSLPKGSWLSGSIKWSPDARRFACAVVTMNREGEERPKVVTEVMVFDLTRGSSTSIFSRERTIVDVDSWSADGKTVRYIVTNRDTLWPKELREVSLDGAPDRLVAEITKSFHASPDGRWKLADKPGLAIVNTATGEITEVLKEFSGNFVGWTPDSKMLVYRKVVTIQDEAKQRSKEMSTLWLTAPEAHRLNSMCAALDIGSRPSFSRDCLKMAYVSQNRVCLAQLGWSEPDILEKIAAGIPLTEDEEKDYLMNSAKQIGLAAAMYMADWDGKLPSSDAFMDDLAPYIRGGESLFFRPGTQNVAFQYFNLGDNASGITNPSEAVMGMFDVGYGWQVLLFADGHVEVKPK